MTIGVADRDVNCIENGWHVVFMPHAGCRLFSQPCQLSFGPPISLLITMNRPHLLLLICHPHKRDRGGQNFSLFDTQHKAKLGDLYISPRYMDIHLYTKPKPKRYGGGSPRGGKIFLKGLLVSHKQKFPNSLIKKKQIHCSPKSK